MVTVTGTIDGGDGSDTLDMAAEYIRQCDGRP